MDNTYQVFCYTRTPVSEQLYSNRLAYSMHLACAVNGQVTALNHNTGILFARSTMDENHVLTAKSLKSPYIFHRKDGGFGVVAIRTGANGEEDSESKGCVLLFTSPDLISYKEIGLLHLGEDYITEVMCELEQDTYRIHYTDKTGKCFTTSLSELENLACDSTPQGIETFPARHAECGIAEAVPGNMLEVSREVAERLINKLTVPQNIQIEVPAEAALEELPSVMATAIYSDGTKALKPIDWDLDSLDEKNEIRGVVHQDHYEFPLIVQRADPNAFRWKNKYYFIATNDTDREHTFYVREADSLPAISKAEEHLILDTETYPHIKQLLWAPEFHEVDGELYIFHAATPDEFNHEQCHVMKLKTGGSPIRREDWETPRRVVRKDGSPLNDKGISLDMTCFEHKGDIYVSWSHRERVPYELGAWTYIAKVDKKEPWRLISDPVPISRPDYGWACNRALIDEGPNALITDQKVFITMSCSAVDNTYCVGALAADADADLLNPDSWTKCNYPILTSHSLPGEYGTGHNSYVKDENGEIWNIYHGRHGLDAPRSTGIRRVHFDIDGFPRLDLTEDKDLNQELKNVKIKLRK